MSAPALHITLARHGGDGTSVIVVLLPGLGGNGLSFPTTFVSGVMRATGAHMGVRVTYGLPVLDSAQGTAAQVWRALADAPLGLPEHPPPAVLVLGYSMGGFVAQCMTQAVPLRFRLQGLILVSTAMPTKAKLPVPLQSSLRTLRSAASTKSKCRHASEVDKLFPKEWLDSITPRQIHELVHAVAIGRVSRGVRTAQLHLVSKFLLKPPHFLREDPGVPVLVMHGARDDILSYSCMKAASARRPWTTFVSFPDAGHALFIQCEEDTVAHIGQWFADVADAAGAAGAAGAAAATPSPYAATVWAASPSITWECL